VTAMAATPATAAHFLSPVINYPGKNEGNCLYGLVKFFT
jgi:hypothetical protein